MYLELKSKTVRTAKWHSCEWCGAKIEAGSEAYYRAYVFDGDFMAGWMHTECAAAMHTMEFYVNEDDSFMPGDFSRGSHLPNRFMEL